MQATITDIQVHRDSADGAVIRPTGDDSQSADSLTVTYGTRVWLTWKAENLTSLMLYPNPGQRGADVTDDQAFRLGAMVEPRRLVRFVGIYKDGDQDRQIVKALTIEVEPLSFAVEPLSAADEPLSPEAAAKQQQDGICPDSKDAITLSWHADAKAPMALYGAGLGHGQWVTGKNTFRIPLSALTGNPSTFTLACRGVMPQVPGSHYQLRVQVDCSSTPPRVDVLPLVGCFELLDPDAVRGDNTNLLTVGNSYQLVWAMGGADAVDSVRIQPPVGQPYLASRRNSGALPANCTFKPSHPMQGQLELGLFDKQGMHLGDALPISVCVTEQTDAYLTYYLTTNPDQILVGRALSLTLGIEALGSEVFAQGFNIYVPVDSSAAGLVDSLNGVSVKVSQGTDSQVADPSSDDWQGEVDADANPPVVRVYPKGNRALPIAGSALEVELTGMTANAFSGSTMIRVAAQTQNTADPEDPLRTVTTLQLTKRLPKLAIDAFQADKTEYAFGEDIELSWSLSDAQGAELILTYQTDTGLQTSVLTSKYETANSVKVRNATSSGSTVFTLTVNHAVDSETTTVERQLWVKTIPAAVGFEVTPRFCPEGTMLKATWKVPQTLAYSMLTWRTEQGLQSRVAPAAAGEQTLEFPNPTSDGPTTFTLFAQPETGARLFTYDSVVWSGQSLKLSVDPSSLPNEKTSIDGDAEFSWDAIPEKQNCTLRTTLSWENNDGKQEVDVSNKTSHAIPATQFWPGYTTVSLRGDYYHGDVLINSTVGSVEFHVGPVVLLATVDSESSDWHAPLTYPDGSFCNDGRNAERWQFYWHPTREGVGVAWYRVGTSEATLGKERQLYGLKGTVFLLNKDNPRGCVQVGALYKHGSTYLLEVISLKASYPQQEQHDMGNPFSVTGGPAQPITDAFAKELLADMPKIS